MLQEIKTLRYKKNIPSSHQTQSTWRSVRSIRQCKQVNGSHRNLRKITSHEWRISIHLCTLQNHLCANTITCWTRSSSSWCSHWHCQTLSNIHIRQIETYFCKKGTAEVKQFVKPLRYNQILTEVNVLIYTERVLPNDKINIATPMTKTMKDLQNTIMSSPSSHHSPLP